MMDSTTCENEVRSEIRAFAVEKVAPLAEIVDREQRIPSEVLDGLRRRFLGCALPRAAGGGGISPVLYGVMNEELGRISASVQGVLNVHNMASQPVARWGDRQLKNRWLPRLAGGELLAAIAITEAAVGSNAERVQTTARPSGDHYVLNGAKRWITCGQIADVFLVLARCGELPTAFLVRRDTPGLAVEPIRDMLGCRGYMLAELTFSDCRVPAQDLVGRPGFGFSHVISHGLDVGRYGLAWGCVGLAQGCLDVSIEYASRREQFGSLIRDHQLIQRLIANMSVGVKAARLLCREAGRLRADGEPSAIVETTTAKYFASRVCADAARDAVQIHGANGCSRRYAVERYFRDSKIMEIIEGTSQVLELLIATHAYTDHVAAAAVD